jgi:hypothetical protein
MGLDQDIQRGLKEFGKRDAMVFTATVTGVNVEAKTISILDIDELEFVDVRLSAAEDDANSLILVPKLNSTVLVAQIGNDLNTLVVVAVNEVELIKGKFKTLDVADDAGFTINLTNGTMKLNGDEFGGMVKAPELKAQVDKNTLILQQIQAAFSTWVPTPSDGGAVLKGLSASFTGLQRADLTNIENTKIKHG